MHSVILTTDHLIKIKTIKIKAIKLFLIPTLISVFFFYLAWTYQAERNRAVLSSKAAHASLQEARWKQDLLVLLRTKAITIGQGLDIVDVILEHSDVPIPLVVGIIQQESNFRPDAVSKKGARGLMQTMPIIFRYYTQPTLHGKNQMHDPVANMRAGIMYLADLHDQFGDWDKVLRAYVAGPNHAEDKNMDWYVREVREKAKKYGG